MRLMSYHATLALLAALLLSACALPVARPAPGVTIADASNAAITAERRGDVLILDVRSETGIGAAQVTLPAGDTPRDIILRLHLRGLESLTFAYDAGSVHVAVPGSGEPLVSERFTAAGTSTEEAITRSSPLWMELGMISNDPAATPAIPLQDGHFDVSVPPDFLAGKHTNFALAWIDFYR